MRNEKNYISFFDEKTGQYIRISKDENGKYTDKDTFMTNFPELLDVGIMGHCIHGQTGLCLSAGIGCYQDGLNSDKENMSLDDFKSIINQCKDKTYQIALGGCGDPDQHENFEEILIICRENGIVPNFTTSGFGMNDKIAELCKKYCGAVAVSWYRNDYTMSAIHTLISHNVKTNIHYVLSESTVHEALLRLKNECKNICRGFPDGINALVFLLHKPVGLGKKEEVITENNIEFQELIHYIDNNEFPYKIGFDSCTVPALIDLKNTISESVDTCEAARWSAYISPDMKIMPCSFDNQSEKWAVDLRTNTIERAWYSEKFNNFRNYLRYSCPECEKRDLCMGGCPVAPEIVLCGRKEKRNYEDKD